MLLGELNFNQFVNQHNLRNLPINEQVRQYDFYIQSLVQDNQRQNKGPQTRKTVTITGFLLQEDLSLIQQENSSGIYIT